MSIADEARAEAEKRWPVDRDWGHSDNEAQLVAQGAFVVGAEWQAPRKPEAAPSDTDRGTAIEALAHSVCQKGGHIPNRDRSLPGSCDFHRRTAGEYADIVLASRTSQPVQAFDTERAKLIAGRLRMRSERPANVDDRLLLSAAEVIEHLLSQPVQVEVTDWEYAVAWDDMQEPVRWHDREVCERSIRDHSAPGRIGVLVWRPKVRWEPAPAALGGGDHE